MWKEIDEMNKNTHGHVMPEHREAALGSSKT